MTWNTKTSEIRRRFIAVCFFLLSMMICPTLAYAKQSATAEQKETKISVAGLTTRINKAVSAKAVIKDDIQINPSAVSKVDLQYYEGASHAWKTVKTYRVKKGNKGKLTIKYPSTWKNSRKSQWRILAVGSGSSDTYVSKTVSITSSRPAKARLSLSSRSAVIIRASDGYIIYGKNKDRRLPNASTTKMLTALLTMEKGNLNSVTRISKNAAGTYYGCLEARAGMKFNVNDLLNVMLIRSSNDAAACLAETNAGSIKNFCNKMNKRAKQLGCRNTHFINPHGLHSSRHYSSAYDLALIQRECMKHQTYMDIVKKRSYTFNSVDKSKKHYSFPTTNELLGTVKGLMGGKTGHTSGAGHCFCGIYKYNGVVYIYTVLGNESSEGRWKDCRKLMKFIKKNYE